MLLDVTETEHAMLMDARGKAAERTEKARLLEEQRARWERQADERRTARHAKAKELRDGGMRCNCDLDNWEPERSTGHSHVCRIHKAARDAVP